METGGCLILLPIESVAAASPHLQIPTCPCLPTLVRAACMYSYDMLVPGFYFVGLGLQKFKPKLI